MYINVYMYVYKRCLQFLFQGLDSYLCHLFFKFAQYRNRGLNPIKLQLNAISREKQKKPNDNKEEKSRKKFTQRFQIFSLQPFLNTVGTAKRNKLSTKEVSKCLKRNLNRKNA